MRPTLALLVPMALFAACNKNGEGETDVSGEPDGAVEAAYALHPGVGGQGVTDLKVHLEASSSSFDFGETALDLGEGITVVSVTVEDGWNATAVVDIAPDAALGARDAILTISGRETTIADGFEVVAESFRITPEAGKMGETIEVAIVGNATGWTEGYTWVGFGEDVRILDFAVLSNTLASARIAIAPDARPGPRDVAMEDGPHVVSLYDGFTVDRAVITATFDPPQGYQGDTVDFEIHGLDTDFADGATDIEFWDDSGANADIEITELHVLAADEMYGRMRLSNAARIGSRDVLISYEDESVLLPDAFEVLDAPPDLSNVAVGLRFDVERAIDNTSGQLAEAVYAQAYFIIPLDPPCGAPPPPGSGPMPYDANGVFPVPPEAEPVDCPNPETVSAGDVVWFEGTQNVVTLDKTVIESTGQIIYVGYDLTLEDYHFDEMYDLHTQGDPDGVPEVTVPDVQPTVPADYYILSPAFWNDFTIPRDEEFHYEWTPAQTYPDAIFSTSISGTLVETGEGGFAGSIPWDDGVHSYTGTELSQLNAGPVSFSAASYIEGPEFGLPFSTIQTCQSDSTLSTGAYLILE